jgi:hypothetical protein
MDKEAESYTGRKAGITLGSVYNSEI